MSWSRVRRWLEGLQEVDPAQLHTGLSAPNARLAWRWALDALGPEALARAEATPGDPWPRATVIAARTVFTGPLEWVALLLGRGSEVVLKHPEGAGNTARCMMERARACGLPLTATADREAARGSEFVLAMGSDETMDALRAELPDDTVAHLLGHRFSVAWIPADGDWEGLALDLALHDSRGCLSPVVAFTDDATSATPRLAAAMQARERDLPIGEIAPAESGAIRARAALARVVGSVTTGDGWSIHRLPVSHWRPTGLPRSLALVEVESRDAARQALQPWQQWLSTVADPDATQEWFDARIALPGSLQRPPVDRLHDGIHVLGATAMPPTI